MAPAAGSTRDGSLLLRWITRPLLPAGGSGPAWSLEDQSYSTAAILGSLILLLSYQ